MLLLAVPGGAVAGIAAACFVAGVVLGALAAFVHFRRHIRENPPISESQVRELYRQTGKKLSEAQLMRIMKSIHQKD